MRQGCSRNQCNFQIFKSAAVLSVNEVETSCTFFRILPQTLTYLTHDEIDEIDESDESDDEIELEGKRVTDESRNLCGET